MGEMDSAGKTYFKKGKCCYKYSVLIVSYNLVTCSFIAQEKILMNVGVNKQNWHTARV